MHSYLFVSKSEKNIEREIEVFAKKKKLNKINFEVSKIEDVRTLNNFTRLSVSKPTAIVINHIDNATNEALNAFLKNLEEPQKNIFYLLSSTNIYNLPETIVSRCQIININSTKVIKDTKKVQTFLDSSLSKRIEIISSIRLRPDAIEFIEKLIFECHKELHKKKSDLHKLSKIIKNAGKTHTALKANGNVNLQLTNLVINLV